MGAKPGKDAKVSLGSTKVLGLGTWNMDGFTPDQLDDTEFGDEYETYMLGLKRGGNISFNGYFDPTNQTGQQALIEKHDADTNITDLRLYIDNTSYFEPCQTTGYLSPYKTTGANTPVSHVNVLSYSINTDKGALAQINFTARVSGVMVLV